MENKHIFLLKVMEENWLHARQAEDKRILVVITILLIVAFSHIAFAFTGINKNTIPLTLFLAITGFFGLATNAKLYERSQFHISRARKLRNQLDLLYQDYQVETLLKEAEEEHSKKYIFLKKIRLNSIWLFFYALIIILGGVYAIIALQS